MNQTRTHLRVETPQLQQPFGIDHSILLPLSLFIYDISAIFHPIAADVFSTSSNLYLNIF